MCLHKKENNGPGRDISDLVGRARTELSEGTEPV